MSEISSCLALFGNVKLSDLDVADNAFIFADTLDILLGALEVQIEKSEPSVLGPSLLEISLLPPPCIARFGGMNLIAQSASICFPAELSYHPHSHAVLWRYNKHGLKFFTGGMEQDCQGYQLHLL